MRPRLYSRRDFLRASAATAGLAVGALAVPGCNTHPKAAVTVPRAATSAAPTGPRTVNYRWHSFFDTPMPRDVWEQRAIVGYGRVRKFTYPVTLEYAEVPGPDVYPDAPDANWLYCPSRLEITARNLSNVTIDTIGGVNSPAQQGKQVGFLPYNLMGGLVGPLAGGQAHLTSHLGYIGRDRAFQLKYPTIFGYHGWENEMFSQVQMDAVGVQKILGAPSGDAAAVLAWFNTNKQAIEQAWWYWLFDEGGDAHVGGTGRLNVRYAFDTPMQMWLNDLTLQYDSDVSAFVLGWDWVNMAGDMLVSRWLSEALASPWESNSYSDIHIDLRIGPSASDLDVDTGQDYALYKDLKGTRWSFEPARGDVPNLTKEYLDEGTYVSPAIPYASKTLSVPEKEFTYMPAAWDLADGETLSIEWGDIRTKGGVDMSLSHSNPGPTFSSQIDADSDHISFKGPLDFTSWSKKRYPSSWAKLADSEHPQGLLPWGVPFVVFDIAAAKGPRALIGDTAQPGPVAKTDKYREPAKFPDPKLESTPGLPTAGRTLKIDLYSFLDPYMVRDRWKQYEDNEYMRIVSLKYPVEYLASPYFPPDPTRLKPYSIPSSGLRFRAAGRTLPEINIDNLGGGADGSAGFLPRNLMGGLEGGVTGGTATIRSHLGYGTRERETLYRMPDYWGYYAWENFWDVRLTLDRPGARKVLGITDAQFGSFKTWFATNSEDVRHAWRQWFYDEFRRVNPMAWFNYPLQVWGFLMDLESADASKIVLNFTVLNEALDVVIGRWFLETFLPHLEASWEDMYLNMAIGPSSTDLDIDATHDWGLSGYGGNADRKWWWEPFLGDNPYLSHEYRQVDSSAYPYYPQNFTDTPSAFDLAAGEQLNLHHGSLALVETEPTPGDFPGKIVQAPGVVSFTGPLDLTSWHKSKYPEEWAATGGLLPASVPHIAVQSP